MSEKTLLTSILGLQSKDKFISCTSMRKANEKGISWKRPMRSVYLGTMTHVRHGLFASEPIGSLFHQHATIFEIPKYRFIMKPSAC